MTTSANNDTKLTCASPEKPTVSFTKPRYQTNQGDHGYDLEVEVPGAGKSDVTLSLNEDVLTILAERSDTVPESWKPLARELPTGNYQLRLRLDGKIDPDGITAKLENGILDVNLPLKEASKARVIKIK